MPATIPFFAAIPLFLGLVFLTIGIVVHKPGSSKWPLAQGVAIPSGFGGPLYEWRSPDGVFRRGRSLVHSFPLFPGKPVTVAFDPDDFSRFRLEGPARSGLIFIIIGWILIVLAVLVAALLLTLVVTFPEAQPAL